MEVSVFLICHDLECGQIVTLTASDPIMCSYCGYRVVFKLPREIYNQYEAI